MPDLLSLQNAPQQTLMSGDRVRQAERHASIAVRWTLTTPHARRPEALLRHGLVEPWHVDADAQPTILAWMWGHGGQAVAVAHDSRLMQLLGVACDELLRVWSSLPRTFLRETCLEAPLQVVPKRLPRDLGKVGGFPRKSPRALPEEGAGCAFLCDRGWRPLNGRES